MRKSKKDNRLQRAKKIRAKHRTLQKLRLVVNRTSQHIYAQIIKCGDLLDNNKNDEVLASASTTSKSFKALNTKSGNIEAAKIIGKEIAEKAKSVGIDEVSFDRSGYMYHGRVQALADSARESGLKF